MSAPSWARVGIVIAVVGAMVGFASAPPRALSSAETATLLRRLCLSGNPGRLDQLHLRARESWIQSGHDVADDETDEVFFYHSVPLELQQSSNGLPFSAAALNHQKKLAEHMEKRIDEAASAGDAGRLLNLDGEIWPLRRFVAQFVWSGHLSEPGPDGRPSLDLHFVPAPHLRPSSRMQRILSMSEGDLRVDPDTGQVLGGSFHSLGAVKFGGGLLAHIAHFEGLFEMQPAPGVGSSDKDCWVMKRIVVQVQGRELFHRIHGTETMTYAVEPH